MRIIRGHFAGEQWEPRCRSVRAAETEERFAFWSSTTIEMCATSSSRRSSGSILSYDRQRQRSAVDLTLMFQPDVILLDLNLPELSGIDVCQRVRQFSDAYILMLTASDDLSDKLVGLSAGADDYVTKPCSMPEVIARIRALMRRTRGGSARDGVRAFGDLRVDPSSREVSIGGTPVALTRIEFDLLDVLSADPKTVVSRVRLLERVWGPNWHGDDHIVDVHMSNLRRKIGSTFIRTVRGVGYRLGDAA